VLVSRTTCLTVLKGHSRAIWSGLDAVANPLASLVIAAGLVRLLGATEYGLMVVALAISALSTAINPAISTTTTKFVSEAVAGNDEKGAVGRVISTSLLAILAIDLVLISGATIFAKSLAAVVFGPDVVLGRPEVTVVLQLAVASVCVQQLDGVFAATLKGLERFRNQATVEVSSRFLLVLAVCGCAWVTRDVESVLVVYCCVSTVSTIVRAAVVMAAVGNWNFFVAPDTADLARLLRFGSWMWLNASATIAYTTLDRIVVGRVGGPAAAAEYNVYLQFAQMVHFIPASIFAFTFPVFSRLSASSDNLSQIARLYHHDLARSLGIAAIVAVGVAAAVHFLEAASSGAFAHPDRMAFYLLLFSFLVLAINVVPYYLSLGMGGARAVSLITSTSMLASLALTLLLTPLFGLTGAALARLAYGTGAMSLLLLAHHKLSRR
jgi:O-antigen/teichoic acid export membrane protein